MAAGENLDVALVDGAAGGVALHGPRRRWATGWRRATLTAALVVLAAAGVAYTQKDRIAPEVADTLRSVIGDERTARVESWFFRVEDRMDRVKYRLFGGSKDPFATERIRVQLVPREPAREVLYTVGSDSNDPPIFPDPPPAMRLPETRVLSSNPEPGEGVWTTAGLPRSSPGDMLMAKTFVRPDDSRPYASVGVLLVDRRRIRLHLMPGTVDPGGSRGVAGPGAIPEGDLAGLLAAWNGGFKGDHGNFGMIADGVEYQHLRNGLATICTRADGTFVVGEYGRDFSMDDGMTACRQNAVLLVDGGEVSHRTAEGNDTWGYVQVDSTEFITWRSAVGVTAEGDLMVAAGNSLSADSLARALWAAGAKYAMQLDINSPYVLTSLFFAQGDGSHEAARFMDSMPDSPARFLRTQERDFMYVTLDEARFR